jgi:hypothetical protein
VPTRVRLLTQFVWVVCGVVAVSALSEVAVWAMFALRSDNPNYAFGLLTGAGPLLLVAFLAFTQPALSGPDTFAQGIRWVLWTTAIGLVPLVVGGLATSLFLGHAIAPLLHPRTYTALVLFRYSLVAAIAANAAAFALAWFTPTQLPPVRTRGLAEDS